MELKERRRLSQKKYRENNKEKINAYQREYNKREDRREKVREYQRKHSKTEKCKKRKREYAKEYRKTQKYKRKTFTIKGRYNQAQIRAKHNYNINNNLFDELFKNGCRECGFKSDFVLDFHHKDKNRLNNLNENLIYLCPTCHANKHRKKIV